MAEDSKTQSKRKPTLHEANNGTHNKLWGWLQDVGYGIANIFGQGETADKIFNSIDHYIFGGPKHLNATELIKEITDRYGVTMNKARQLITYLDKKSNQLETLISKLDKENLENDIQMANLPPALSSNVKKIVVAKMNDLTNKKLENEDVRSKVQKQREQISNNRNRVVTDLSKVESEMNTAQQLASQQDMLSPSRKAQNQEQIHQLLDKQPNMSYLNDIERSIK